MPRIRISEVVYPINKTIIESPMMINVAFFDMTFSLFV